LKPTGRSLPDWLNVDLKSLSEHHRQVLYWNILFPGAGFVFAGDRTRSIVFGTGSIVFLLAGMGLGLRAVRPVWTGMGPFLTAIAPAAGCFILVIVLHVLSILTSPRAAVPSPSRPRAIAYLLVCMGTAGIGIGAFLLEIVRSMM